MRDGTTLRLFLLPDMIHVTLQMSGLRSPQTKLGAEGKPDPALCEPFAVEVVEVVNGDALMVKAGGTVRKLYLASIRRH